MADTIDTFLKKPNDQSFNIDTLLNKIITTESDTEKVNDIKTKIRELYEACKAETKTDDTIVAAMTALNTAYKDFTPTDSNVYPNYDNAKPKIHEILESMSSE